MTSLPRIRSPTSSLQEGYWSRVAGPVYGTGNFVVRYCASSGGPDYGCRAVYAPRSWAQFTLGPKSKPKKAAPGYDEMIRREQALRLYKLAASGAQLNAKARRLAGEHRPPPDEEPVERDKFTDWSGGGRWVAEADLTSDELRDGSVDEVVTALRDGRVGHAEFRGLAAAKPVKAARVLRRMAADDIWPPEHWQQFLQTTAHFPNELKPNPRLQSHVAGILCRAPNALFAEVESAAAEFVKGLAHMCGTDREESLKQLWTKAWNALAKADPVPIAHSENPITDA